jgi:aspartate kinase
MVNITAEENISLATFHGVPLSDYNSFVYEVFDAAAKKEINIDMISGTPAATDSLSLGFTFPDENITAFLAIAKQIPIAVKSSVSTGNVKITVKSDNMRHGVGFASRVFNVLKETCTPLLISTGVTEIAVLVYESDGLALENALRKTFEQ